MLLLQLYLAGYLLTFTYALPVDSGRYINIIRAYTIANLCMYSH